MAKFTVDLEKILLVKKFMANINKKDLHNIRVVYQGEVITFTPDDIKNGKFTGLNNVDVILMLARNHMGKPKLKNKSSDVAKQSRESGCNINIFKHDRDEVKKEDDGYGGMLFKGCKDDDN